MTKKELAVKVAESTEMAKKDVAQVVDAVFAEIANALAAGDEVNIHQFGKFDVRERAARTGVNPLLLKQLKEQGVDEVTAKAQAKIDIPASKSPAFKAAKSLKEAIH